MRAYLEVAPCLALICVTAIIWARFTRNELRSAVATTSYIALSGLVSVPLLIAGVLTLGMASSFGSRPPSVGEYVPLAMGVILVLPVISLFLLESAALAFASFLLCAVVSLFSGMWPITIGIAILASLWHCVRVTRMADPIEHL